MSRCIAVGLLCWIVSCGAADRSTKPLDLGQDCATLDERLSHLTLLLEQGRLAGLKQAISQDMSQDERTRLVDFLFDVVDALPEGTFSGLQKVTQAEAFEDQIKSAGNVVKALVAGGDVTYKALGQFGVVLNQCTGRPLLVNLDTLLAEPGFRDAMMGVLEGDLSEIEFLAGVTIDFSKVTERAGFQSLVRNLLVSMTRPDFSAADLPIVEGDIGYLINALLAPGPPLASVQLVAQCMVDTDTKNELPGLIFDVLHAGVQESALDSLDFYGGGLLETIDRLVRPLIGLLKDDENARNSLVVVISALVQFDTAKQFFPDLVVMFDEGIIADVITTLVTMATGEC